MAHNPIRKTPTILPGTHRGFSKVNGLHSTAKPGLIQAEICRSNFIGGRNG